MLKAFAIDLRQPHLSLSKPIREAHWHFVGQGVLVFVDAEEAM